MSKRIKKYFTFFGILLASVNALLVKIFCSIRKMVEYFYISKKELIFSTSINMTQHNTNYK